MYIMRMKEEMLLCGPASTGRSAKLNIYLYLSIYFPQQKNPCLLVSIGLVVHVHDGPGMLWTTGTAAGLRVWPIYRDISVYCPISES